MYRKTINIIFIFTLIMGTFYVSHVTNAQISDQCAEDAQGNITNAPCDETSLKDKDEKPLFGLVPCGNVRTKIITDAQGKQSGGNIVNPCNFDYAIMMFNKLVGFALFKLFVPLAAIMFCYAGFLLLFSGGDTGKLKKAKGIFLNVFIGLLWAVGAWLVIHTISEILGYKGSWIGF